LILTPADYGSSWRWSKPQHTAFGSKRQRPVMAGAQFHCRRASSRNCGTIGAYNRNSASHSVQANHPPDGQVLASFDGKPQSPNAITKEWARTVAAVGMPEISLHSLRHTHASMLIASGMDVLTVSRRLGHGSPTITLRVYGHLIHGTDDRAAQIMEEALGSKMVADGAKNREIPA
jgi:integrase